MKSLRLVLLLMGILSTSILFAQKSPYKFGKISKVHQEITTCDFDSTANAIILFDCGTINMGFTQAMIHTRHKRIKILNKKGFKQADISIPFYHYKGGENVRNIKAHTINFDENGKKIVKKVEKDQIFENKINEYWSEIRFTFPALEEGSILEFRYIHNSDYFTFLKKWYIQDDVPTLESQLQISIEEGLDYRSLMKGNMLYEAYKNQEYIDKWVLKNIPALKDEIYCPNHYDFAERVQFQLAGYYRGSSGIHGGREYVRLMDTWENLVKELVGSPSYQNILGRKGKAKKLMPEILNGEEGEEAITRRLYEYVTQEYIWDEKHRLYPDQKLKDLLEKKTGSSADLNVFLVLLLKTAGLDAHPAIISTKENGFSSKLYPLRSQFNHALAAVKINGKYQLLDDTDRYRPMTLLPKDNLNFYALLLEKRDSAHWVDIVQPQKSKKIVLINMDYSDEKEITGKVQMSTKVYDAVSYRSKYKSAESENAFIRSNILSDERFEIDEVVAENTNDVEKDFKLTCNIRRDKEDMDEGDFIYIDPFFNKEEDHPFIDTERHFPIDFYFTRGNLYLYNIIIPDGYEVEELPESKRLSLLNKECTLKSNAKVTGQTVQVLLNMSINTPIIGKEEYNALRKMFDFYISMQQQQIVLKRKKE